MNIFDYSRLRRTVVLVIFITSLIVSSGCFGQESGEQDKTVRVTAHAYDDGWIHVNYPQIEGMTAEGVQNKINATLKKQADAFIIEMKEVAKESKSHPNYAYFTGKMEYELIWQSDKRISLLISTSTYTGGAHGASTRQGYTFDLTTGEELLLKDIVNEKQRQMLNHMILQQIQDRNIIIYDPEFQKFTGIGEKTAYYLLNDKKLVVVFQQYEIAPYSSGILEFELPY